MSPIVSCGDAITNASELCRVIGLTMGAAASSSSSLPPATIILNRDQRTFDDINLNENNIKTDDDVMDLEQVTSALTMADKIKALTTICDKTYQKLGRVSSSVNEESALLLERKIKRYDAKIETLKDQEDRYDKDCALHRDDIRQRKAQLNSHLMLFVVLQGLLVVAASSAIAIPVTESEGVATGNTHYYVLLMLTVLGLAVSLVTLLKVWDNHTQQEEILQLWDRKGADEAISRTCSASEHALNVHGCRRNVRSDLILPILFLAGWSGGLLLVFSKLA